MEIIKCHHVWVQDETGHVCHFCKEWRAPATDAEIANYVRSKLNTGFGGFGGQAQLATIGRSDFAQLGRLIRPGK